MIRQSVEIGTVTSDLISVSRETIVLLSARGCSHEPSPEVLDCLSNTIATKGNGSLFVQLRSEDIRFQEEDHRLRVSEWT
jgi:hypothetical protein